MSLDPTILPFEGKAPRIHRTAFVAPGARIVGDVEIGAHASVWYNCVLRGDINRIVVGARSNLQDGTVVHVEGPADSGAGLPALIGEGALVGHGALLHGCIVEDGAFVGMGSVTMDGARVSTGAMLAAGALLPPGKTVPRREIWTGRPARKLREISEAMLRDMAAQTEHYVHMGRRHAEALRRQTAQGGIEGTTR